MNKGMIFSIIFIVFLLVMQGCSGTAKPDSETATPSLASSAIPTKPMGETVTPSLGSRPFGCPATVTESVVQGTPDATKSASVAELHDGMDKGCLIVEALEQYKKGMGIYPSSLDQLVPGYLGQIPSTVTNQQFEYKLLQPSEYNSWNPYILTFVWTAKLNAACTYHPSAQEWECGPINAAP